MFEDKKSLAQPHHLTAWSLCISRTSIPYYGRPVQLLRFRLGLERDLAAVAMPVRHGAILR